MSNPITIENLAQVVQDLQTQLQAANSQINNQQNSLNDAAASYDRIREELQSIKTSDNPKPKKHQPEKFSGRGSITSWATHMDNYLANATDDDSLQLAVSYLSGAAHEWWIVYQKTDDGSEIKTWNCLRKAIISRFETLNKEKVARDKLARWRQVRDVSSFNDDFQRILLDIPTISMAEQIDRYTRGLKQYIWKELCTKDYRDLAEAMRDAERVEAAHRRLGPNGGISENKDYGRKPEGNSSRPVPMELGNIQIKKLTKEEREQCMKKGLCLHY